MREIAQRAGVSVATVSRVLNGVPRVNAATKARIQAILDAMSYVPHGAARTLSSHRSSTIGIIVPLLGTTVFSEAVQAIEERLQEMHYYLLTASNNYEPDKELDLARAMIERGVDGVVLVGGTHVPALYTMLDQARVPAVQTFVVDPQSKLPSVGFDNYTPAYDLTSHLIALGHRDFAVLHGMRRNPDWITSRFGGIVDCLRTQNIAPDPALVVQVSPTVAGGRRGFDALLRTGRRFTAIVCTGDVAAIGALIEARHRNIVVPDQISVTGFHDLELATHTDPPLTTVHAPVREMARQAANILIAHIGGGLAPPALSLPTSIILRKSIGPARLSVANSELGGNRGLE